MIKMDNDGNFHSKEVDITRDDLDKRNNLENKMKQASKEMDLEINNKNK